MGKKSFKNWWFLALNGLVLLIFGLMIVFMTKEGIEHLLRYFGVVMLVVGGILLLVGINNLRRDKSGVMILFQSFAGIAIGLSLLLFPKASVSVLLILVGIWAIMIGIVQLIVLVNIKQMLASKNLLLINGLLTMGLGIALLFNPFQWAVFVIKGLGVLSALFGVMLVYFSFVLRSVKNLEQSENLVIPKEP
jgi:uncharacterized membrane protein HdeD (DUF308 family)